MIEKLLKEIEGKLRIVSRLLEEKGQRHESLSLHLWPNWDTRNFKIQIWTRRTEKIIIVTSKHDFAPEELTQYLKGREILFQKFSNFSD